MDLGAVQFVEHARGGDEDDALGGQTGLVGEGTSEECLAGSGRADEERVDPLVEEVEVVETEVSSAELLSRGIEVEVEGVDGVDLREARVAEAAVDGALDAALLLLVAKAMENVEGRGAA